MSREKLIRWGVIGLGVGHQHAITLLRDPNSQLVSVCDKDPRVLHDASSAYGEVSLHGCAEEMILAQPLDAIVVASYDWDHASAINLALARGIHVFAEKPVGTSLTDYEIIMNGLNNEAVRLTTNTLLRYSPRFTWLKQKIDSGDLGEIVHIQADYLYGRLSKLTHGWRGSRPDYSVTLGGAIHMVDLVLWLTGSRPESVVAIGSGKGAAGRSRQDVTRFAGDSLRAGLLTFPNGTTATVSANFGSVGPHFHLLNVFGTAGTFMNQPTKPAKGASAPGSVGLLLQGADPGTAEEVNLPYPDVPKGALLSDFNRALLGFGESPIPEQEVMDTLAVCLALDSAVASAQRVDIEYREVPRRHYVQGES